MNKAIMSWSGGKDAAMALYRILQEGQYEVKYLFTSVSKQYKRITMHGVREEMLQEQAKAIGIPLRIMYVSEGTNEEYEQLLKNHLTSFKREGITHVVHGDIFLDDLKKYRSQQLEKIEMTGVYPLWKEDTLELTRHFQRWGFKAVSCCVDSSKLGEAFAGEELDTKFFNEVIKKHSDPCGENGEYHSFVYDGPIFKWPLKVRTGEKIFRALEMKTDTSSKENGFWYCDILTDRKA